MAFNVYYKLHWIGFEWDGRRIVWVQFGPNNIVNPILNILFFRGLLYDIVISDLWGIVDDIENHIFSIAKLPMLRPTRTKKTPFINHDDG